MLGPWRAALLAACLLLATVGAQKESAEEKRMRKQAAADAASGADDGGSTQVAGTLGSGNSGTFGSRGGASSMSGGLGGGSGSNIMGSSGMLTGGSSRSSSGSFGGLTTSGGLGGTTTGGANTMGTAARTTGTTMGTGGFGTTSGDSGSSTSSGSSGTTSIGNSARTSGSSGGTSSATFSTSGKMSGSSSSGNTGTSSSGSSSDSTASTGSSSKATASTGTSSSSSSKSNTGSFGTGSTSDTGTKSDTGTSGKTPGKADTNTSPAGGSFGCGSNGNPSCGGGNSDPVMYGFAGRSFNFMGDVGKTYSIISTQNLQVSMKLKLAQMWDHNGTNMEAIGFMYRSYKILIALNDNQELTVTLQDKPLKPKKNEQHHAWHFEDGAYIETSWDQFKPGLGNTVVILTDVMKMTIWQTPAGIVDEGGVVLQSWLNFGVTLLGPPANGIMHGVVGGTYDRYLEGESAVSKPESQLYIPADDAFHGNFDQANYEMSGFWDTQFPANLFGMPDGQVRERSSLEVESAFPAFARACSLCEAVGQSHTF